MSARPLILASSSVYRRSLLERLRLPFACIAPDIDETPHAGEPPAVTASRLALAKALAVAPANPHALIIGSDQVAELNGAPAVPGMSLGKPGNHENALRQLQAVRGKRVVFHTAVCLLDAASGRHHLEVVPTVALFRDLSDAQIERYLMLDQPYDCASSAKIESLGVALLHKVESDDPTALIGLPLMTLVGLLKREGVEVI